MNEIRKLVELIEEHERLDEITRKEAIDTIDGYTYAISLHVLKLNYYPDHTAINHWKKEIVNFINSIIKRTRKVKLKRKDIFMHLTIDVLTSQEQHKMVFEMSRDLGDNNFDYTIIYNIIENFMEKLSHLIAKEQLITYNELNSIL